MLLALLVLCRLAVSIAFAAVRRGAAAPDRDLCSNLCDGNVLERFDHRCHPVCSIFDFAHTCSFGDRERIFFLGLMAIPYTLSFPGVFEPGRSLIGGLQSTPWLYILRHCGFAMFLSAFALLKDSGTPLRHWQPNVTLHDHFERRHDDGVVFATAFACITGDAQLTIIVSDRFHFDEILSIKPTHPSRRLYIFALTLLRFQRHTVLGLLLMVVKCVHLVGVPPTFYPSPIRFGVGWYTVVIMNLLADSLVLIVLLAEVSKLYARILLAARAQHREREARFATGDAIAAHEVKQPLSALVTRAETSI